MQYRVPNYANDVLEIVVGGVFPADQIATRLVFQPVNHGFVGLCCQPRIEARHQRRFSKDSKILLEALIQDPQTERLLAGIEFDSRPYVQLGLPNPGCLYLRSRILVGIDPELPFQGTVPTKTPAKEAVPPADDFADR